MKRVEKEKNEEESESTESEIETDSQSINDVKTYNDEERTTLDDIKNLTNINDIQYPGDVIYAKILDDFEPANDKYEYYIKPEYRDGLMLIPPPVFFAENLWTVYETVPSSDNNIYNLGIFNLDKNFSWTGYDQYRREARFFSLYSINNAKEYLSDVLLTQMQNEDINWIIVRPVDEKDHNEYLEEWNIYFEDAYTKYIYNDNIVIGWHDDWFEKYPSVWVVNNE